MPLAAFLGLAIALTQDPPTVSEALTGEPPAHPSEKRGELGPGVPTGFWVRPGFRVTLVAEGLEEARFLQFDDRGTLYATMPGPGKIVSYRLKDGKYQKVADFATGYRSVHGIDFADGWIWFTTSGAIYKAKDANRDGKADEVITVIAPGELPSGGGHWWRPIAVTKNGFFTGMGDAGNINDETATDRQKIFFYNLDGTGKKLWSSGIRNTEKLRLRPGTDELYGADHGSDWFGGPLGDRQGFQPITDWNPPCEFNHYVEGGFYGHPFVVGNKVPRVEFQTKSDIVDLANRTIPPAWSLGAHHAPNGWTFLTKPALGADFVGDALVALHGSWNRRYRAGYRVERILFDKVTGQPFGSQMLVGTLTPNRDVQARPCDVVEGPDGAVLFTDSQGKRIFRITKVG